MGELNALYWSNLQFKDYVDRYAQCYRIPAEVALTHFIVGEYAAWMEEKGMLYDE